MTSPKDLDFLSEIVIVFCQIMQLYKGMMREVVVSITHHLPLTSECQIVKIETKFWLM